MKKFYKFTCFFSLLTSLTLFLLYFIKFINNVSQYIKEDNKITKETIAVLMENNLVKGLIILMIGLSLTSIVSLLIKTASKNSK